MKSRSCVTVFGSCSETLTVGEPLGDVSGSANHDFRTSVTGISGEIDASNFLSIAVMPRVHSKCVFGFEKKKRKRHWLATPEPLRGPVSKYLVVNSGDQTSINQNQCTVVVKVNNSCSRKC